VHALIIEDDRVFAEAFGEIVESLGLGWEVAPDGQTGLRRARELEPKRRPCSLEAALARDLLTAADRDAGDSSCRFHRGVQDDRQKPVGLVR